MKVILNLGMYIGLCVGLRAQPTIQWQRTYGGSDSDEAASIDQTSDGGFILACRTVSTDGDVFGNHGGSDYWLVKLNEIGQVSWKKAYGGTSNEKCYDVKQTIDGGYIVAGLTSSNNGNVLGNHGDFDAWILKLNNTGIIEWQRCYGGTGWEEAWSICQTSDSGFVFVGRTGSIDGDVSGFHGGLDVWAVKISQNGEIQWQKALGGSKIDLGYKVRQTKDGGYIIAGESDSDDGDVSGHHGNSDFWVVKLNHSGLLEWQKQLGSTSLDFARDICQLEDGALIVFGQISKANGDVTTSFGGYDFWLAKLGLNGELIWERTIGGSGWEVSSALYPTTDGGFLLTGSTDSNDGDIVGNNGGVDFLLVKLDSTGNLLWQKTLGGTMAEHAFTVQQTVDEGYVVGGLAWSNNGDVTGVQGYSDAWIVKLAPETSATQSPTAIPLNLYPNPATTWITLNLPIIEQQMQVNITDEQGKLLLYHTIRTDEKLNIAALPRGVYWVSAISKSGQVYAGKFVKG